MFGLTQDEKDEVRQQEQRENKAKRIRDAFRDTFNTTDGRIVLDYLVATFCECPKLVPGYADATAENLGMEKLVREIIRLASRDAERVEATYQKEED